MQNELDRETCKEMLSTPGCFDNIKRILEWPKVKFIVGFMKFFVYYLDMIKDSVLVLQLLSVIGGIEFLIKNPTDFLSGIVIMLIGSIVLPITLGGLRITLFNPEVIFGSRAIENTKNRIIYSILSFITIPIHSAVLNLRLGYIVLKVKANPKNKNLCLQRDEIAYQQKTFAKIELGLETIFQIIGVIILLLMAKTQTKTYADLKTILEGESLHMDSISHSVKTTIPIFFGLIEVSKQTLFMVLDILGWITVAFSFFSCVRTHLNVLSVDRVHSLISSTCIMGLSTTFAITKRVLAVILYFTPVLGLFDLLRHWQAEQTPWHPDLIKYFFDNADHIQFGDSHSIPWKLLDRWNYNSAPPYTLYTLYKLKHFTLIFWGILFLHIIVIMFIKWKWSQEFSQLKFLDKIIHSLENTNISYNTKEWDSGTGNAEDHKRRMKSNLKEGIALIVISCFFNCVLIFPLCILGMSLYNFIVQFFKIFCFYRL